MSNYNPNTTLGQIKLDSVAYSAEKLSALINSGFVSKGKYNANKELTIQQVAPLSVITLNKDTYIELDQESKIENDALYLVETDNIDAFQKPVSNVGNPVEANDAANKHYVDTAIQECALTYQYDTILYRLAHYYANDGASCLFTDFMLNEMFYGLEGLDTVKIQEITFVGRENIVDPTNISLSIFDRTNSSDWSSLDESQAIATSTKCECSLTTQWNKDYSYLYKFTFNNVELSTNTIYTFKFSNALNVRVIFGKDSTVTEHQFKFGTLSYPNLNGFAAVYCVGYWKVLKYSGVIFSDMLNPDNKYKLCVRNGKISLNLII